MAVPNRVIYWSGHLQNINDDTQVAEITQRFSDIIIQNPSGWMVAVERFELNLNGVPFYDGGVANQLGLTPKAGGLGMPLITLLPVYSLPELIESLNAQIANSGFAPAAGLTFTLDKHGYVRINWANFPQYTMQLSQQLAVCLGLPQNIDSGVAVSLRSSTPRFDAGDNLNHVVLRTNLPVVSDRIGQVFTKTLADFSAIKSFGSNVSLDGNNDESGRGFGFSPRQQMVYVPAEKRFVDMSSNAPIDQIEINAYYTDHQNRSRPILLPKGCGFSIKLGFYSKR